MAILPRWIWDLGVTLVVAALAFTVVTDVVWVPSPVRVALVLPVVVFLPGYAIVNALYPARPSSERTQDRYVLRRMLGWPQRVALSVGISLVVVSTSALVANFSSYGIAPGPVVAAAAGLTVAFSLLAMAARAGISREHRVSVPGVSGIAAVWSRLTGPRRTLLSSGPFEPASDSHRLLNVFIVASVVIFAGSVAFVAAVPQSPANDAQFTEYSLLTRNADGEFTSENLPKSVSRGEQLDLHVGITNHEGERTTYTTVVLIQQLDDEGDRVENERQIGSFETTVDPGETKRPRYGFATSNAGETRVVFLLYRGEPPADPTVESAYRMVRLQFTVGGGN